MENINILINKATRMVVLTKTTLGNDGENFQENLVFSFSDEFVDGTARLELTMPDDTNSYIMLTKVGETYQLPVKSVMTQEGKIRMQLVITEGSNEEDIPIFKSNVFSLKVRNSINAETISEDEYPDFIDRAETKLNSMDEALDNVNNAIDEAENLDLDATQISTGATITITKKDGTQESVSILNGQNGSAGQDGADGITPTIGDNGNWYLGETDTGKPSRGIQGETGATGAAGSNGVDGVSPTVTMSKSGGVTTVTITDKNGDHTTTINDGTNGSDGQDGFSPIANVSQSGDITTISITDKSGTTTADIDLSGVGGVEINKIPTNVYLDEMEKGVYYFNKDISSYVTIYTTQGASGNSFYNPLLLVIKEKYSSTMPNGTFAVLYYCDTYDYGIKYTAFYQRSNGVGRDNRVFGTVISTTTQTFTGKKIFSTIPEVNSYTIPTTNTQLVAKKYVDDMIASIGGGSTVGIITDLLDETYTNRINFKKSKVGTYVNNKGTSIQFINKLADDWSGFSSIDNLETLYVVEDISNITTLESDLIFAYAIVWQFGETLKLMKFTLNTSLLISATQTSLLPQITSLTQSSQQIQGEKTFLTIPKLNGTLTPTQDAHLVNKKYVDDSLANVGVETDKIPSVVYLNTIKPGVYYYNKDISSTTIQQDENSGGWSYYKPFLLIVKENYKQENPQGEPIAVVYYSGSSQYPAFSFSSFSNNSSGILRVDNSTVGDFLTSLDQYLMGKKTFYTIPEVSSYSAPTQNTQLVAKKYVDDKIGDINTILATLTTPGGNE